MSVPAPEIILLARYYSHQIEIGRDPREAGAFLRREYGATATDVTRARYYAQRAMAVGRALATMGPEQFLSEALGGMRQPAPTVGVRVELDQWLTDQPQGKPWRTNTLYVEAEWGETLQEVIDRAVGWLESRADDGYGVRSTLVRFVGPSLWPNHTPGLGLED